MALCGAIVLEEALDLSFDRLLMMIYIYIYIYICILLYFKYGLDGPMFAVNE